MKRLVYFPPKSMKEEEFKELLQEVVLLVYDTSVELRKIDRTRLFELRHKERPE